MPKTLIIRGLSETTYKKLIKKKEDDNFGQKGWADWLTYISKDVRLEETTSEQIQRSTRENLLELWCKNFAQNLPHIRKGKTIADLTPEKPDDVPKGPAIVIGAGPSIQEHNHLELLADSHFQGTLILTDRMLIPCLKKGVTPDKFPDFYVVGVDGAPIIAKWYNDPIVEKYGPHIKTCLIVSSHPDVRKNCEKARVQIYWFNPLFDDWRSNESFTRIQIMMTKSKRNPRGVPSMAAGGNAGCCAWVMAHALLRRSPLALIGLNLGWTEGTPLEKTTYYSAFLQAVKDPSKVAMAYREIYNPYFKCKAIADPIFFHYAEAFKEMARETPEWVTTINATEGGILFGEPYIHCMKFADYLEHYNDPNLKQYFLKR